MIGGLSVLALIPARGGSKGLPLKNILPVGGKPLIAWTIDAARASKHIDRLVLSSDDEEIIRVAKAWNCEAPFVRGAELASDTASSMDVVLDAVARVPGHDIVVLLQPTSPLREAGDIDATLELLASSGAPACVTVRPVDDHPYWTFRIDAEDRLQRFAEPAGGMPTRRQDLPAAWCLNGAVYAARVSELLVSRSFVTAKTAAQPMPADRSADIDTQADIEQVEAIMAQRRRAATNNFLAPEVPS